MRHNLKGKLWQVLTAVILITTLVVSCKKDKFEESPGVCPIVISTNPSNGALAVPINQIINGTFNEKMDPSTVVPGCFELSGPTTVIGNFSYNDDLATFTFVPSVPLLANTTYTGRVKTSVRDMRGNALQKEYVWSFSTGLILTPIVLSTIPFNNEINVEKTQVVSATFSYPMDPTSIKDSSFKLFVDGLPVTGVVSTIDSTAYFTPSNNLLPGKVYTATISTMVKTLNKGNMASNYTWKFTTKALVQPVVILTYPIPNQTGIPLNQVVRARFNMDLNPLTVKDSSFYITDGTNKILGTISYIDSIASFTPSVPLLPSTVYTATITTMVKSLEGAPMASNHAWSFTTIGGVPPTVISTDPAHLATNVLLNKVVSATFSATMDPTSISNATFTLKLGATNVTGIVNYSGNTATFTPSVNLLSGNVYTATITNGVKNMAGTFMAINHVWTFTTKNPAGPLPPNLNSVARFGIIAGVGVTNQAGFSVINNLDVGISPGVRSSVSGFPPAIINNGAIYASDDIAPPLTGAMLTQAKADLMAAYIYARDAVMPAPATVSGDQGGLTLAPGIYKSTSTLSIQNGNLTLDAQGDANAVWIFQIGSSFTTIGGAGGNVILTNGAQAKNVYWQVSSSATIGDYTTFQGNVLALTSITMNSHATITGRILCSNGAVVMTSTNTISKP